MGFFFGARFGNPLQIWPAEALGTCCSISANQQVVYNAWGLAAAGDLPDWKTISLTPAVWTSLTDKRKLRVVVGGPYYTVYLLETQSQTFHSGDAFLNSSKPECNFNTVQIKTIRFKVPEPTTDVTDFIYNFIKYIYFDLDI